MKQKGSQGSKRQDSCAQKAEAMNVLPIPLVPNKGSSVPLALNIAKQKVWQYQQRYDQVLLDSHKKALLRKLNFWKKEVERLSK